MTSEALAQLSNAFVYSAIAVYSLAMIAFAAYLAFGSRGRVGRLAARSTAQLAGGAGDNSDGSTTSARSSLTGLGSSHAPAAVLDDPPVLPGRAERLGRIGVSLTVLGFGLHLAGTIARPVFPDLWEIRASL